MEKDLKKEEEWIFPEIKSKGSINSGVFDDEDFVDALSNDIYLREILLIDDSEEDLFASRDQEFEAVLRGLAGNKDIPLRYLARTALLKFQPILKKYESNPELFDWGSELHSSAQGFVDYLKRVDFQVEQRHQGSLKVEGFDTSLTDDQISCLYEKMKGIYIEGDLPCFQAIFKQETQMDNFTKIKWILPGRRGQPHKTALREFFKLQDITPTQRIVSELITDKNGNEIELLKQKKGEYSTYYSKLKDILKSCKIPTFEI